MCEYALVTLNRIEYPSIYPKKPSAEYVRTLNMSDAVHTQGHETNYGAAIKTDIFRMLSNIEDRVFCKRNNA